MDTARIKNFVNKPAVKYGLIVLAWLAFNLLCMSLHERWRDEGTAYLIAKNANFRETWELICADGNPLLWFLFARPFVRAGLSYANFSWLSLFVMLAAVLILLLYCKLPLLMKTMLIFSPVFSYANVVMPRPYCLAVLILVTMVALYERRGGTVPGRL